MTSLIFSSLLIPLTFALSDTDTFDTSQFKEFLSRFNLDTFVYRISTTA